MKLTIFIILIFSAALYSSAVYTIGTNHPDGQITDQNAVKGKMLWQEYNCTACHQVYGLGGYMGPDLTNVISMRGEDYARAFLLTGTPRMPNFHFTSSQINDLVAYLKCIDKSGIYPPVKKSKTFWGDIVLSKHAQGK